MTKREEKIEGRIERLSIFISKVTHKERFSYVFVSRSSIHRCLLHPFPKKKDK